MPDPIGTLAAYLRARWDEDVQRAKGEADPYTDQWHTMLCGERQLYWLKDCNCGVPAAVLADVEAKRALLDELVNERCESWCSHDTRCDCELTGTVHRRVAILCCPFVTRDDFPADALPEVAW